MCKKSDFIMISSNSLNKTKMVFPLKLYLPAILSSLKFIFLFGANEANDAWNLEMMKMRNVTVMLPAAMKQFGTQKCPKGIPWDNIEGFNIELRLADFEKLLNDGKCLNFYLCYESIFTKKIKPQYQLPNIPGKEISHVCNGVSSQDATFHGISITMCLNGNGMDGTIEQSTTNYDWKFKVPNESIEKAVNIKLEFSANSMELNFLNGKEVTTLISQQGMMDGIYNLNEGREMFRNGIHNRDNCLWFTAMDATFITPYGNYLFNNHPHFRHEDYFRHFRVFYPNVCGVSKENGKTTKNEDVSSLVIECHANQKEGTVRDIDFNQCGKRHPTAEEPPLMTYISKGQNVTDMTEWPWLVLLKINMLIQNKTNHHLWRRLEILCSGTIIDRWHVLTAGHCIAFHPDSQSIKGKLLSVALYAGQARYTVPNAQIRFGSEIYANRAKLYFCHQNRVGFEDDIAVIKLWHPFDFNERVSAICLTNETRENLQFQRATSIGWGHTRPDADIKNKAKKEMRKPNEYLHMTGSQILNFSECLAGIVQKGNLTLNATEIEEIKFFFGKRLCALGDNGSSPQRGDSGGPLLMYNEGNGHHEIVGVASSIRLRNSAEDPINPAIYMDVTHFRDWINNVMNGLIPANVLLMGEEMRNDLVDLSQCPIQPQPS